MTDGPARGPGRSAFGIPIRGHRAVRVNESRAGASNVFMDRTRIARAAGALAGILVAALLAGCAGDLHRWRPAAMHLAPASGSARPPAESAAVDLVPLEDGRFVMACRLNGHGPFRFLVDTGSAVHIVTEDVQRAIGLDAERGESVVFLNGGSFRRHETVLVREVDAGPLAFSGMRMLVEKRSRNHDDDFDGVIGFPAFDGSTMTMNLGEGTLQVTAGPHRPAGGEWVATMDVKRGIPRIPVMVESPRGSGKVVEIAAVIDTGFARTPFFRPMLLMPGRYKTSNLPGESVVIGTFEAETFWGRTTVDLAALPEASITIGDVEGARPFVLVHRSGPSLSRESGFVGLDFLAGRTITFDIPARRVYFAADDDARRGEGTRRDDG